MVIKLTGLSGWARSYTQQISEEMNAKRALLPDLLNATLRMRRNWRLTDFMEHSSSTAL